MIEVEMVTTAGVFEKGKRYVVGRNHWLVWSGYAKVVGEVELVDSGAMVGRVPADDRGRVVRRRSKKVKDGQDSAESGGGSPVGADGGSSRSDGSGAPVGTGDEADGSAQSGTPVGQPEA